MNEQNRRQTLTVGSFGTSWNFIRKNVRKQYLIWGFYHPLDSYEDSCLIYLWSSTCITSRNKPKGKPFSVSAFAVFCPESILQVICVYLYLSICTCSLVSDSLQLHGLQPPRLLWEEGFPRQEYWSGLSFPSPGDLPNLKIKLCLLHWQEDSLPLSHLEAPQINIYIIYIYIYIYIYNIYNIYISSLKQMVF